MDDISAFRPVVPLADKQANTRQRAHLGLGRVLLGLAVAPLLGAVVMTWAFHALDGLFAEEESRLDWRSLAAMLFSPSLWSVISGLAYLQTVTRMRGQIARYECLLLGCASAYLMPLALTAGSDIIFYARYPDPSWRDLQYFALFDLITLPFGLFGGWVFWRLGIRPATAPTTDFAAVFD